MTLISNIIHNDFIIIASDKRRTVIVNQNGTSSRTENVESEKVFKPSTLTEKELMLQDIIKSGQNEIQINTDEYGILSKNILIHSNQQWFKITTLDAGSSYKLVAIDP